MKEAKADCDIMSDHSVAKAKYQELVKLSKIKEMDDEKFKIKIEPGLTPRNTSLKMPKPADLEKMTTQAWTVTLRCDLGLASSMPSEKHPAENDDAENTPKKSKNLPIEKNIQIMFTIQNIESLKKLNTKLQENVQTLKCYYHSWKASSEKMERHFNYWKSCAEQLNKNIQNSDHMGKEVLSLFSAEMTLMAKLATNTTESKVDSLAKDFQDTVDDIKKVYEPEACFLLPERKEDEIITLLNSNVSWEKLMTKHSLSDHKV